jgi:hypothetical protein
MKQYDESEFDEKGNFKETLHPLNILRWLLTAAAVALLAWMMGYFK